MYVLGTVRELVRQVHCRVWKFDDFADFFSDFWHTYEYTRVTNAPFYDGGWLGCQKKRRVKELRSSASKIRAKVFTPNPVSSFVGAKVLSLRWFSHGTVFLCNSLAKRQHGRFLLRWWASAITPAIVEKHVWLESVHLLVFFFIFARRFADVFCMCSCLCTVCFKLIYIFLTCI